MVFRAYWEATFHCAFQWINFFLKIVSQFWFAFPSLSGLFPAMIFQPPLHCFLYRYYFGDLPPNQHYREKCLLWLNRSPIFHCLKRTHMPTRSYSISVCGPHTLLPKSLMIVHPTIDLDNFSTTPLVFLPLFQIWPQILFSPHGKLYSNSNRAFFIWFTWYFISLDTHGYSSEIYAKLWWFP